MVSATQLSTFLYCPRKLFIKHVLLIKEPVKAELIKGLVWHITHEQINKNEEKIVKSLKSKDYAEIFDVYRREYAKFLRNSIITKKAELKEFSIGLTDIFKDYWPKFEEDAKRRALNIADFIAKHNVFGQELWDKLSPKLISEQYIKSERLNLSGIIDVVEVYDKDVQIPVELKTGKVPAKGMWDTHRVQLGAYMMMLEDTGKTVPEAVVKYKDAEDTRILQMNTLLREEVMDMVTEVRKVILGFDIPDKVQNKNKCTHCSYKEKCYDDSVIGKLIEEAKEKKSS